MPNAYQVAKFSPLIQASFSFSSSGDNSAISGTTGQTIRIMRMLLSSNDAVDVEFFSNATQLSGPIHLESAGGAIYLPEETDPHYVTLAGNDFIINLNASVQVGGTIWYFKS